MFDSLINSVQGYGTFSDEQISLFLSKIKERPISKGELILDQGETCQELSFVVKGSFREYYRNDNLDDVIVNLFIPNDWMLNHSSFTSQKPSSNKIEAFDESEVFTINMHDLHDLIGKHPSFFALGKILETAHFSASHKNPKERYLLLLNHRPDIIKKFPLKYIASYLEMTPETLSRVRNRIR